VTARTNVSVGAGARSPRWLALKRLVFPGFDPAIRKRLRLVRHFLRGPVDTLDAGCGNGAFSLAAYALGNRVLGVSTDLGATTRCREYASHLGVDCSRLQFRVADVYKLGALGRHFDQVVCFETLEHLVRDQDAVLELAGVLKPGGLLHLCTPNRECALNSYALSTVEDGGHVRVGYTHAELERLVGAAGLVPERRDAYGGLGVQTAIRLERLLSTVIAGRFPRLPLATALAFVAISPILIGHDSGFGSPLLSVYVSARRPM